jgi:hypothetical protein
MRRNDDDLVIEQLLSMVPVRPGAEFTDLVMRRVSQISRTASQAAPVPAWLEPQPVLPWWTRALLEPMTILAFVAAALLAGWPSHLMRASSRTASTLAAQLALVSPGGQDAWVGLLACTLVVSLVVVGLAIRSTRTFFAAIPSRPGSSASR